MGLSRCSLDHKCLDCNKYCTDACNKCFKHEFKRIECRSVGNNCSKCDFEYIEK